MTYLLAACAAGALVMVAVTGLLLFVPVSRWELRVWRGLRVRRLRRWLTRTRRVNEPLHPETTVRIAVRNLQWHLLLTALFCWQLAVAAMLESAWWRPLALVLVVPCAAYLAGSLVQRQKIAVTRLRSRGSPPKST